MFSFLSHGNRKILTLIGILIIAASIPLTAMLAEKAQDLRKRAAPNGTLEIINPANNQPFPGNQTSNQNVLLKITLPDGWSMASKESEKNLAQNQSVIPKAYATHENCSLKTDCASCTNFASDCYWEQRGNSGSCKDGVRGECTAGVTWWAYTTGQCNLPFFCPAQPTNTPAPTATPGPTNPPPPSATPTLSARTTCTSLTMNPSSGAVGERVNVVAQYTGATPSTIEVWLEGEKLITDSVSGGGSKSVRVTIPNFALGTYTAYIKFGDSNGVLMNGPLDCTARFTITSLTSPTATPPPGGGNTLSQVHIKNVDSNGTGGFAPARVTGSDLNPYKSGNLLLIPWKLNNGNGQHTVEVVLYANNQTIQTAPITASITLTGAPPAPTQTPIGTTEQGQCQGTHGSMTGQCAPAGSPNNVLQAAWNIRSVGLPCNVYIRAEKNDYKVSHISTSCFQIEPLRIEGILRDLRGQTPDHTITNDGIYELWVSNGGSTADPANACLNSLIDRVTLNCGAPAAPTNTPAPGQPTPTPTITPGAGAGPGQGAPEVAKCESVTLNGLAPGSFPLELNKNYNARIVMRNVDPEGTITNQRDWVKSQDKLVALGNTNQIWTPRNPNPPPFTWDEGVDTIGKAPQNDRATFAFTIRTPSQLPETDGYEFKWAMQKSGTSQPFGGACDLAFQASDFTAGADSGQTIVPVPVLLQEFAATSNRPARTPRRQSRPDTDVTLVLTTDRTKKFEGKINLQWEGRKLDVTDLGFFNAIVNFAPNTLPLGLNTYDVLVKEKNHLRRTIGINIPITTGQEHEIVRVGNLALFPGDVNNDNKVDITDHSMLVNCFGDKMSQGSCSGKAIDANLDDDEDIDIFDYNWLVENYNKQGEQ